LKRKRRGSCKDVGTKEGGKWARCTTTNYSNRYRMGIMGIFNNADRQSSIQGNLNNNQQHDSNSKKGAPVMVQNSTISTFRCYRSLLLVMIMYRLALLYLC
jgi:hypothetical protein